MLNGICFCRPSAARTDMAGALCASAECCLPAEARKVRLMVSQQAPEDGALPIVTPGKPGRR